MQYQKEEVRNRILCAAYGEFLKYGFYRASMLQISSKARVPIGNLYRYFKSKEALFEAIVGAAYEETANAVRRIFEKWLKKGGAASDGDMSIELIREIAEELTRLSAAYRDGLTLLIEKSDGSPYAGFVAKTADAVYGMLNEGVMSGLADEDEVFVRIVARSVTEGIIAIITKCEPEVQSAQFIRLLVFYFGNMKGRLFLFETVRR